MKTLQIDWTRCDGHGLCAQLYPGTITLDDWGYPIISKRPLRTEDDVIRARRAVAVCPALALRLNTSDRPVRQGTEPRSRRAL